MTSWQVRPFRRERIGRDDLSSFWIDHYSRVLARVGFERTTQVVNAFLNLLGFLTAPMIASGLVPARFASSPMMRSTPCFVRPVISVPSLARSQSLLQHFLSQTLPTPHTDQLPAYNCPAYRVFLSIINSCFLAHFGNVSNLKSRWYDFNTLKERSGGRERRNGISRGYFRAGR